MDLNILGWNSFFEKGFESYCSNGFKIGRVCAEYRQKYKIFTEDGELTAEVSGKFRYNAYKRSDYPSVGDWVLVSPEGAEAIIHALLPRKSMFARKAPGPVPEEQIIAANVDIVFLVSALNNNYNLRRLERYLVLAWESGAKPVIVLNKADLCDDAEQKLAEVSRVAVGVPVHMVSCVTGKGMDELGQYLVSGNTIAILGSSGVGKSTIINYFIGRDVHKTGEIRECDHRGRHTTTHRQLVFLPQGGMIIDTPGMRELQFWEGEDGLKSTFEDIEALAAKCRFGDCKHQDEPGCAVMKAFEEGKIDSERYESYKKLQKEMSYQARKEDVRKQQDYKKGMKRLSKEIKRYYSG